MSDLVQDVYYLVYYGLNANTLDTIRLHPVLSYHETTHELKQVVGIMD